MLYFISCVVVHCPLQKKRGENSVATETKPSLLYKHQFATVHIYSRARILFLRITRPSDLCFWTRGRRTCGKGESKRDRGVRMSPFGFRLINSHRRRLGTTIITSRWVDRRNENFFSLTSEIISPSLVSLCVRSLLSPSKYLQIFQSPSLARRASCLFHVVIFIC